MSQADAMIVLRAISTCHHPFITSTGLTALIGEGGEWRLLAPRLLWANVMSGLHLPTAGWRSSAGVLRASSGEYYASLQLQFIQFVDQII
jgi:hypothetical protein